MSVHFTPCFKTCLCNNSHNKNLAIPESHLEDDDNVDSEALVSLLTLLFVFEESSPFFDLVSEMKITLKLKENGMDQIFLRLKLFLV